MLTDSEPKVLPAVLGAIARLRPPDTAAIMIGALSRATRRASRGRQCMAELKYRRKDARLSKTRIAAVSTTPRISARGHSRGAEGLWS